MNGCVLYSSCLVCVCQNLCVQSKDALLLSYVSLALGLYFSCILTCTVFSALPVEFSVSRHHIPFKVCCLFLPIINALENLPSQSFFWTFHTVDFWLWNEVDLSISWLPQLYNFPLQSTLSVLSCKLCLLLVCLLDLFLFCFERKVCFRIAQLKSTFCFFELFFFLPGITVFLIVCFLDHSCPFFSHIFYTVAAILRLPIQPWFDRSVLTPSLVWCGTGDVKPLFCHMYEECVSSVFFNLKPHFCLFVFVHSNFKE